MTKTEHITHSASRILFVLNLFLSKSTLNLDDLINHLNNKFEEPQVSTKEVILKYIKTLKMAGFEFKKNNKNYELVSTPYNFDISSEIIDKLLNLIVNSNKFYINSKNNNQHNLLNKIQTFLPENHLLNTLNLSDYVNLESFNSELVIYEKFCTDSQRLKLCLFGENGLKEIICEPNEIRFVQNKFYFDVFDLNNFERKFINFDLINEVIQLPQKSKYSYFVKKAKIKLTGKLAKSYTLKENEQIIAKNADYIVVLTQYEDKNRFIKRILRYGELCEIVSPFNLRNYFINYIKELSANYH